MKKLGSILLVIMLLLAGCRDGRIPCPDIGSMKKIALFKKKKPTQANAPPGTVREQPLGENVNFDKNGLVKKKKKYKYSGNKANRKRYTLFNLW